MASGLTEKAEPARARGTASDILVASALLALAGLAIVYRSDALPMQLWDESRNANNALELVRLGHWLAPTYGGLVDHWNTKPPLLIWLIAGFMKLGLAPLWALRAPSMIAALATLAAVWCVPRFALRDRAAAAVAGAILVSSTLYLGIHVARTGDYDALESGFILAYVLCAWRAFETPGKPAWLAGAAAFVVLAVLTKGVAGVLPVPGLAILALARPGVTLALVRNWRTWACALAAIALPLAYYLTRETYDPGYLAAVIANELGGRFNVVQDGHVGGPLYYLVVLALTGATGLLLLPFSAVSLHAGDERRRNLALASLGAAVSLLLAVSSARTKIYWYAAPAVPLISLAAGVGVADAVRLFGARARGLGALAAAGVAVVLTIGAVQTLRHGLELSVQYPDRADRRIQYGPFMSHLWRAGETPALTVMDSTFWNRGAIEPIDRFYMRLYSPRWRTSVLPAGESPRVGQVVLTCDAKAIPWLETRYALALIAHDRACLMARVDPRAAPPLARSTLAGPAL